MTSEAWGSGCVLLVSEAAGAICKHMETPWCIRLETLRA